MIRFESSFDAYAYRMSFPVKNGVTVERTVVEEEAK